MSARVGLRRRFEIVRRTWRGTSAYGRRWAVLYVLGVEPWAWMEDAQVNGGPEVRGLLGEDEDGFIYVPSRTRDDWWDRRYDWRNPTHWRYYLRSRLTHRIVMLEVHR